MKIVCVSYRDWALKIYSELAEKTGHEFLIISAKDEYSTEKVRLFNPDFVLFYGWSWYVEESLLNEFTCLMLHPAPLPKYRGGSPIQNQIIDGHKQSMVTIFKMTKELDAGDILKQAPLDLSGRLSQILERISVTGTQLTLEILENNYTLMPQNHDEATYCKRRTPQQSEITPEEIATKPAEYLYNKIRMLEDPYPNAYIKTADNKKLLIKIAEIGE